MELTFWDYFLTGASFLVVPFLLTVVCLVGAFIVLRTAPEREVQRKSECKFILKFLCVIAAILLIELINLLLLIANLPGSTTDEVKSFFYRQEQSIFLLTSSIILLYILVLVAVSLVGLFRTLKENAQKRKNFKFVLTTTIVALILCLFVICESYFILDSDVELIIAGNGIAAAVVISFIVSLVCYHKTEDFNKRDRLRAVFTVLGIISAIVVLLVLSYDLIMIDIAFSYQ